MNRYIIKVTEDMKFIVYDTTKEVELKRFDSLELAKAYLNQLNKAEE